MSNHWRNLCLLFLLLITQSTSIMVLDRQSEEEPGKELRQTSAEAGQQIQDIACNSAINKAGLYRFEAPSSDVDCSLFIIGEADQLLELSFDTFDVSCEGDGFLMLIDGWISEGEIFPSEGDYSQSVTTAGQRFREFCGANSPTGIYLSSQNVFQLHFKVHNFKEGFTLSLRPKYNPQPCNVLLGAKQGVFTVRNYGRRLNCSVSVISPASIQVDSISVSANRRLPQTSQGIIWKCRSHQTRDYIELLDGDGLDPTFMWRVGVLDVCASTMQPRLKWPRQYMLGCQRSAVRLVSSGNFFTSLTVTYRPLTDDELAMVQDLPC